MFDFAVQTGQTCYIQQNSVNILDEHVPEINVPVLKPTTVKGGTSLQEILENSLEEDEV